MTLSNSCLLVLALFQKQEDNHESTDRSEFIWVMFHISDNGFSIDGGSCSMTLILRLTNNSVSMMLWQTSEKDEQFLTSHQSKGISETALGLVEGRVFNTLMGSSRVHSISFRSHTSVPSPSVPSSLPFPSLPPPAGKGKPPALAGHAALGLFTCSQGTEAGTAHRNSRQEWEQKSQLTAPHRPAGKSLNTSACNIANTFCVMMI